MIAAISTMLMAAIAAPAQNNPLPLLNQPLVPMTAPPGGPSFALTVNGTGFVLGSVVQWNGAALATQFISTSQLAATVPASNITSAATVSVTVLSPAPGGGVSNPQLFSITNLRPSVGLAPLQGTAVGADPLSLAVADFNGDGKPDLAVANSGYLGSGDTISILVGNGDGTFQPQTTYTTGVGPDFVVVGDFNRDGKVDVAVANESDNTVSVLLGNGDGTFQPHVDYAVGQVPVALAVADFNGDGKLDLAVSNEFSNFMSVLLGNGDGTFQPQLMDAGGGVGPMAVGDFNGDGKLDLAVCGRYVNILLGNGDGTFTGGQTLLSLISPAAVATADFNGDGKLDLAAVNPGGSLSVNLGNGDGTFQTGVLYAVPQIATALVVADLNGDNKPDLAVNTEAALSEGNEGPFVVSTLLGNGDGTFQPHLDVPALSGNFGYSLAASDFNRDGLMDLAALDGSSAIVFLGTTAELSPYIVDFGTVAIGVTSPTQTVMLTNGGTTGMTITSISAGGVFAQTNNCGNSLAPGASCAISVTFTPAVEGEATGSVTVTDSALGSPHTISLYGEGGGPLVTLTPSSWTFNQQQIGTTSIPEYFTLQNVGNENLTISGITLTGMGAFSEQNNCPSTLASGAYCTFTVEFRPTYANMFKGTLSVSDNAPGSPQTVSLTGTGAAFVVSPQDLGFGNVTVGQTSPSQTVTVTNVGKTTLKVAGISILKGGGSVDFAQTSTCGNSLGAGASCAISVTFSPIAKGFARTELQITGGGGVWQVIISGTGIN